MDDKKKVQEAIVEEHDVNDNALDGVAGGCDASIHCPNCGSHSYEHDHTDRGWGWVTVYVKCNNCGTVYSTWGSGGR